MEASTPWDSSCSVGSVTRSTGSRFAAVVDSIVKLVDPTYYCYAITVGSFT